MGMLEKILLGLLLAALASFPVALFLYLRTAYRQGGWMDVRTALAVFGFALLIWAGVPLWAEHCADLMKRLIERPFASSTVILILLSWFLHRALITWLKEKYDHN